jgi:hypothetical protein
MTAPVERYRTILTGEGWYLMAEETPVHPEPREEENWISLPLLLVMQLHEIFEVGVT